MAVLAADAIKLPEIPNALSTVQRSETITVKPRLVPLGRIHPAHRSHYRIARTHDEHFQKTVRRSGTQPARECRWRVIIPLVKKMGTLS